MTSSPPNDNSLPLLYVTGSHYDVFFTVGKVYREQIIEYYDKFGDLEAEFIPFYHTPEGRNFCENYLEICQKSFPQYVEEIRGLANGSGIEFYKVFLMHIRVELQGHLGKNMVPECSTIFLHSETTFALAHNEDTSHAVRGRGHMIHATIMGEKPPIMWGQAQAAPAPVLEQFIAYCYPGVIPGNSIACNAAGYVYTCNALYPEELNLKGVPRQLMNRAFLKCNSYDDITKLVGSHGIATGCSTNIAHSSGLFFNLEMGPITGESKCAISEHNIKKSTNPLLAHYNHFNMYKHMKVEEMPSRVRSSIHRQKTADQLPTPTNIDGMLLVLGDDSDVRYPIYRVPAEFDSGDTVCTGVFDLLKNVLIIYTDNPHFTKGPVAKISLIFH